MSHVLLLPAEVPAGFILIIVIMPTCWRWQRARGVPVFSTLPPSLPSSLRQRRVSQALFLPAEVPMVPMGFILIIVIKAELLCVAACAWCSRF